MADLDRDFERWLKAEFAARGPFTALVVTFRIDEKARTIWPQSSSYATVIGDEIRWPAFRKLLDGSPNPWDGVVMFATQENNGPLGEAAAAAAIKAQTDKVIENHALVNDGAAFDRKGRKLRLDTVH